MRAFAVACLTLVATLSSANRREDPSPAANDLAAKNWRPALDIKVAGNQLIDASGRRVRLVGVNRSGLEFRCAIDHLTPNDYRAMRAWGMNTVRFTLSSALWDGGCARYLQSVDRAVKSALDAGMYVVVALQWNAPFGLGDDAAAGGAQYPLPDADRDMRFWRELAPRYRDDARVLYNVFSEPHDVTCAQLYEGGPVTIDMTNDRRGRLVHGTYEAVGLKRLTEAVRALAPRNVLIAGGLNYAYDLSCQAQGYELRTENLAYATHIWDWPEKQADDWRRAFTDFAATHVVVAEEFGQYDCGTSFVASLIETFNRLGMSFLVWNWGVDGGCAGPTLLVDWNGAPTEPYGAYIRAQTRAIAER